MLEFPAYKFEQGPLGRAGPVRAARVGLVRSESEIGGMPGRWDLPAMLEGLAWLATRWFQARNAAFLIERPGAWRGRIFGYPGALSVDWLERLAGVSKSVDVCGFIQSGSSVRPLVSRNLLSRGALVGFAHAVRDEKGELLAWLCVLLASGRRITPAEWKAARGLAELARRLLSVATDRAHPFDPAWVQTGLELLASDFLDLLDVPVLVQDLGGRIIGVNRAAAALVGMSRNEIAGHPIECFVAAEDSERLRQAMLDVVGSGQVGPVELGFSSGPGRCVPVRLVARLAFRHGAPAAVVWVAVHQMEPETSKSAFAGLGVQATHVSQPRDSGHSEQRTAVWLEKLVELGRRSYLHLADAAVDRLRLVCEQLGFPEGVFLTLESDDSVKLRICWPAGSFESRAYPLFETRLISPQDHSPRPTTARSELPVPFFLSGSQRPIVSLPVRLGKEVRGYLVFRRAAGEESLHPDQTSFLEAVALDLGRVWGQFELERERRRHQRVLRILALRDPWTQLPNALALRRHLEVACLHANRSSRKVVLALLDLDRFKHFNDSFGHAAGDRLLQRLADRLRDSAQGAWVARVSGDRFAIVRVCREGRTEVESWVRSLAQAVRQPFQLNGHEVYITASWGVSVFPDDALDHVVLLQHAEAALEVAKTRGRDEVVVYSDLSFGHRRAGSRLEPALHHALAANELELRFQPEYSRDGSVACLEVLLSWNRPKLGRYAAERFIGVAERSGLIIPIGEWVLAEACRMARHWKELVGRTVRVAVNVSALQLSRSDFVDVVAETLKAVQLDPESLELEITESAFVEQGGEAIWVLSRLRNLGISIALDDFGKGYSSLGYLRYLPIDVVKLDRSFLPRGTGIRRALPVVRSVISMAHRLGLSVVGEGIETEQHLALLLRAKCDRFQGYYLARPVGADKVPELLRSPLRLATIPKAGTGEHQR